MVKDECLTGGCVFIAPDEIHRSAAGVEDQGSYSITSLEVAERNLATRRKIRR